jgi:hypothetical protein
MADKYFAIMDSNNVVTSVEIMDADTENEGIQKVKDNHNNQNLIVKETWPNASSSEQRYNFAFIGGTWDPNNNAFIAPKPFSSYTLDSNYRWEAPVAYPSNKTYSEGIAVGWNESNQRWEGANQSGNIVAAWDPFTFTWNSI